MTDLPPGNSNPGNHYLALHQPTAAEEVLSMGLLQHLPLSAKNYYPAYAIGRPSKLHGDYSDLANRAFWDRFYLSGGVSKDSAPVNKTPIPAPGADSVTGANAEKLLKQGALNINSPYPRAWLAVLASRFGLKPADLLDLNLDDSSDSSGSNIQSVPVLHALRASDLASTQRGCASILLARLPTNHRKRRQQPVASSRSANRPPCTRGRSLQINDRLC